VVCGASAERDAQQAASSQPPSTTAPAPSSRVGGNSPQPSQNSSNQQTDRVSLKEPAQLATGYLRHSIVPHTYRRHFPLRFKSHLSHDIVLLCLKCHQVCEVHIVGIMPSLVYSLRSSEPACPWGCLTPDAAVCHTCVMQICEAHDQQRVKWLAKVYEAPLSEVQVASSC
jgi:hypothetical protein